MHRPLLGSILIHLLLFSILALIYQPINRIVDQNLIEADLLPRSQERSSIRRRRVTPVRQLKLTLPNSSTPMLTSAPVPPPTVKPQQFQPLLSLTPNSTPLTVSDIPLGTTDTTTGSITQAGEQQKAAVEIRRVRPIVRSVKRKLSLLSIRTRPASLPLMTPSDLVLAKIGRHIVTTTSKQKLDLVFIIDASQSMKNDIESVRLHLTQMTDLLAENGIDFTVGIVAFRDHQGFSIVGWDFEITAQTKSILKIKKALKKIRCRGSEKAKDALIQAANEVRFRPQAARRFILVTDEYATGEASTQQVLAVLNHKQISVDVLGQDEHFQRTLSRQCQGIWLPISNLRY